MSRVSAALLAIVCFVTGYGLTCGRVSAKVDDVIQGRRLPNGVFNGDHVMLTMDPTAQNAAFIVDCTIGDIGGGWVSCVTADDHFNPKREQVWYDLSRVVTVKKLETQR